MHTRDNEFPLKYFVLVFILAIPIWMISALLGNKLPIPVNLPISALIFVCPVIAASILIYQQQGKRGIKTLLQKTWDAPEIKNKLWYAPILLLVPMIYFLSFMVTQWLGPSGTVSGKIPFLLVPVFFVVYFIAAACEELGWTGYAIDPIQKRWGALTASLLVGIVWQVWHFIGDLQAGQTWTWIAWHSLYSVALRVLIVWIYNNTGKSVFAAILVHTMDNVSWSLLPIFDSSFGSILTTAIAWLVIAIVVFVSARRNR